MFQNKRSLTFRDFSRPPETAIMKSNQLSSQSLGITNAETQTPATCTGSTKIFSIECNSLFMRRYCKVSSPKLILIKGLIIRDFPSNIILKQTKHQSAIDNTRWGSHPTRRGQCVNTSGWTTTDRMTISAFSKIEFAPKMDQAYPRKLSLGHDMRKTW